MAFNDFPVYLQLSDKDFKKRIKELYSILNACTLCGHKCKVDRAYEKGICNSGISLKISLISK